MSPLNTLRPSVHIPGASRSTQTLMRHIMTHSSSALVMRPLGDRRSHCKNGTICNLLMLRALRREGSAEWSAIAEGSAPSGHVSGAVRGYTAPTRRQQEHGGTSAGLRQEHTMLKAYQQSSQRR